MADCHPLRGFRSAMPTPKNLDPQQPFITWGVVVSQRHHLRQPRRWQGYRQHSIVQAQGRCGAGVRGAKHAIGAKLCVERHVQCVRKPLTENRRGEGAHLRWLT